MLRDICFKVHYLLKQLPQKWTGLPFIDLFLAITTRKKNTYSRHIRVDLVLRQPADVNIKISTTQLLSHSEYVVRNAMRKKYPSDPETQGMLLSSSLESINHVLSAHQHILKLWCQLPQLEKHYYRRPKSPNPLHRAFYTYVKSVFPVRLFPGDLWSHSVCQTLFC